MTTWSTTPAAWENDPTAAVSPPKLDKVLPKYLTADQAVELLDVCRNQGDFPERDYCMVTLFLNCGMRLAELVGMNLDDIDLPGRQIRLFGKGHKERMVYLNDACIEALDRYLQKRGTVEGLSPKEEAVFITRRRKDRISNRRVEQIITGAMKAAGTGRVFHPQAAPYRRDSDVPDRYGGRPDPQGSAGPQQCEHHTDLHPPQRRAGPRGHRGKPPWRVSQQSARRQGG